MPTIRHHVFASVAQWLPLATITIVLSGVIYVTVQQNFRSGANDPQIQIATDARNALNNGATPASLVPQTQIDIAQSLAPYIVIFDKNGQPLAASATLHGQPPVPPHGVFDSANTIDRDVLSWQPESGVRSAIVVLRYNGGYVMAGRSLLLVEEREDDLTHLIAVGCFATLVLSFLMTLGVRLATTRLTPAP